MDDDLVSETDGRRRRRLLERLDPMVESGRVSDGEAKRLRAAGTPGEFDETVRDIRLRHAGTRLNSAVADGTMPQEEADGLLERLRKGGHSRSLRARLRKLRPEDRSGARGHRPQQESEEGL
jgi:hypothetical protein